MTDADFDELVAEHAGGWLLDAAALCRSLDPPDNERTVHVLDAATLPQPAERHALAWTAAGLDELLRDRLRDRRRGPVLVIDAAAIVRRSLQHATLPEGEAIVLGRVLVSQVAIHELGHAASASSALPAGTTLAAVTAAAAARRTLEVDRQHHGRGWIRAYLALSSRAARSVWPREWWLAAALADVAGYHAVDRDELLASLAADLASDEPLDVLLRRPVAPAFLALELTPPRRKVAA